MRIAYLDCASGISGDMTLAALVDAGVPLQDLQAGIDSLGLPDCRLVQSEVKKRGFRACQIVVEHAPEHAHRHLHHIRAMIEGSILTPRQQRLALEIFGRIAEAEAKVHGSTIEKVHFHEVGAVDSIADIVGAAIGWDRLNVDRVNCSPIPTGTGFIEIAHGRVSIPAPATAEILTGCPIAASDVSGELTTPTGAAIAHTLADEYGPLPAMRPETIGYGAGQCDFPHANILRLIIGETTDAPGDTILESICTLETNIDDGTGEAVGHCVDKLWEHGALDVSLTAIHMKKSRPGVQLSVQCRPEDRERLEEIVFRETTTLGIREGIVRRRVLRRSAVEVATQWGVIRGVERTLPDGSRRFSPEYESCRAAADENEVGLADVYAAATLAFESQRPGPRE